MEMAATATATAMAIGMREIEGRGRAMVALRPLRAGEIILRDSPLLLYSALPFMSDHQTNNHNSYCSNCFITISHHQKLSCSLCHSLFCSPNCISAASHTPWACQSLARLHSDHRPDLHLQARFLISAYNLAFVSPTKFQTLLSFQGSSNGGPDPDALSLHSLISSLCSPPPGNEFSLELTCILLAKDKLNGFGLMEPYSEERKDRSVRAYGIYPLASFFNHDCLPNACRFDYVDVAGQQNNTDIIIRMIHDVPQGREICLSYFPINLKYSQRQTRLREDYGFICDCDRCKVEANWSDNEEDDDDLDMDNNDEEGEEDEDDDMEAEEVKGEEDDFPHAYFFLRYMCDRKNCWGTMAPMPPSAAASSSILECNVCGSFKNFDQV